MIVAVLYLLLMIALLGWPSSTYLWGRLRPRSFTYVRQVLMALCFIAAAAVSLVTWWVSMRAGVRALQEMG
jgi:hypothetical protein